MEPSIAGSPGEGFGIVQVPMMPWRTSLELSHLDFVEFEACVSFEIQSASPVLSHSPRIER